ncbi:MFS transporter [Pelagibius marinus]|uniref:MFS transporter n=1 Tax=Pelagibius marinus TaxID=2762760 RepID=UPI001872F0A1|nr:MFS transporter [Pelagibius marinus]
MFAAITSAWALFVGLGMLMLGNGLQNSLLGIRAGAESFTTETTGLIMAAYYVGLLTGALVTPKVVGNVGHVRTFAALASTASTAALVYAVFVDPWAWGAMRMVTGFCYAGLYVVAESWLNDRATNETRGTLLSVYMVVLLGGMAASQFLLNLADTNSYLLFVLASVLVSMALVPISLSVAPAPDFEAPEPLGLRALYQTSPLGTIGALGTGMANAAIYAMSPVYAGAVGLSVAQIALFVSASIVGGMAFQWPIGRLSDKLDRRQVLTVVTFAAALAALLAALAARGEPIALYAMMFLVGGMSLPMYSLCIAHTNDYLTPKQMVSASGTLMMVGGAGAIFGPIGVSLLMGEMGSDGFFACIGAVHAAIGVFALYRMLRRAALPLEEQGASVPLASSVSAPTATLPVEAIRDQMDRDLAAMAGPRLRRR